jgi:hypothetical protein
MGNLPLQPRSRPSRKFLMRFAAAGFLILTHPLLAHAQDSAAQGTTGDTIEDNINKELLDSELGPTAGEEAPPAAEYPYPGAHEEGITPPAENLNDAPKTAAIENSSERLDQASAQTSGQESNRQIQRPMKIDPDNGDYYYDTTPVKDVPIAREADHMPKKIEDDGYHYTPGEKPAQFSNRPGVEKPVEILANGEFKYATEHSPTTAQSSFRVGFFGPPMLKNADTGTLFTDIYTHDQLPVLFVDYEWPLTSKLGHLGLKLGSGLFVASGQGQFATVDRSRRADDIPQERYTFFMFPNTLTAQYRFQYKDTQPIVPYIEGGAGYFTFTEFRDDNSTPAIGGALTTVVSGGVNLMMDWLDPEAIRHLDEDYGINHVFLTLEAREIVGLNSNYDFSSSVFNAGFLFQF